ncbi:MAG: RlmE family RNA methyltransferase [Nitrososphaerota archaeon]|nr:RlmE family RNA methyltransferase [Nitrososphaerota archaeon]MDG6939473.1 RlmE family RNA methyltransferase [Nitrososphaerota archaeon]
MRLHEARKDYYRRLARQEGYASRAAYKMAQLDTKYHIIHEGGRVLDLGCSPGGWSQVACERVGEFGLVVGVDVTPVSFSNDNFRFILGDVLSDILPAVTAASREFDCVVSDLSPKVSGIWEVDSGRQIDLSKAAFGVAGRVLKAGGSSVYKAFQGEFTDELISLVKSRFDRVVLAKPEASRKKSSEIYLVCLGFRPDRAPA